MTVLRLSYEDLAARIGTTAEGARMRARRRGWRVEKDNERRAWVLVEEAELAGETGQATGRPVEHDRSGDRLLEQAVEALRGELEAGRAERARLLAEMAAEREKAAGALREATAAAARGEGEARALRDALADLAGRLDRAEAELRKPLWRRLFGL